jgi:hypothetical protein
VTINYKKISEARLDLANLANAAFYKGQITIITIGKTERAAIVPLSMIEDKREAPPVYADTTAANVPRTEALPSEVPAEDAHSSRAAELASAFEQPPIAPSDDETSDDPADYGVEE